MQRKSSSRAGNKAAAAPVTSLHGGDCGWLILSATFKLLMGENNIAATCTGNYTHLSLAAGRHTCVHARTHAHTHTRGGEGERNPRQLPAVHLQPHELSQPLALNGAEKRRGHLPQLPKRDARHTYAGDRSCSASQNYSCQHIIIKTRQSESKQHNVHRVFT